MSLCYRGHLRTPSLDWAQRVDIWKISLRLPTPPPPWERRKAADWAGRGGVTSQVQEEDASFIVGGDGEGVLQIVET